MKRFEVQERAVGPLRLKGPEDTFEYSPPPRAFEKARKLLQEFQELQTLDGTRLCDAYQLGGFSWYPTLVVRLYFRVFLRYAKYEPLVTDFLQGKAEFVGPPDSPIIQFLRILQNPVIRPTAKQQLLALTVRLNNEVVSRKHRRRMLFCRLGLGDFRSQEMADTLHHLRLDFLEVMPCLRIKTAVQSLLAGGKYYFYGAVFSDSRPEREYRLDHLTPEKKRLFQTAILFAESLLGNLQKEYQAHLGRLEGWKSRLLYAFDDPNDHFFPLLYACRRAGFHTVAHQHAVYISGQVQTALQDIAPEDYPWFDKIIVWGTYWKKYLLSISKLHRNRTIAIGSNKSKWLYESTPAAERTPRTILVPAEFLGDTVRVGHYLTKFVESGYQILFKPKPQRESTQDQLDAYRIGTVTRNAIQIVEKLDPATIARIDIIAGTMSTLIYELLPYRKIVWSLDMEWGELFLHDLVREGLAHAIRLDDIRPPGEMPAELLTPAEVVTEEFFCSETLEETLRKHVLAPLASELS